MAETLAVMLVIIGITAILVCLHCGSEYLLKDRHKTLDSHEEAERLREESDMPSGITRHSLFYQFFFRNE